MDDSAPAGDWYGDCLKHIDELEHRLKHNSSLGAVFAPWCKLCASAAEALNRPEPDEHEDLEYLNASPFARWMMKRLLGSR